MKSITNKTLNRLTILAASLPKLQKKNADGTKMFRKATKRIMGKDLPDSYKKQTDYFPDKFYLLTYEEPVFFDHKQNLIEAYEKHGERGVEDYSASCKKFYEQNKKPIAKASSKLRVFFMNLKSHLKKWLPKN